MSDDESTESRREFHYENGVPVFDVQRIDRLETAAAAAETRDRDYKDEQLKIDREQLNVNKWMLRFNATLVFCTVATGIIIGYQAHVAKISAKAAADNAAAAKSQAEAAQQQVSEMQKGGTDTHTLALAANEQSVASKRQSLSTGLLVESAKDTLHQTRASFQDDQRAWVGIGEARTVQLEEGKPVKIEVTVVNSGKTPALYMEAAAARSLLDTPDRSLTPKELQALKFSPASSVPPQGHYTLRVDFPKTDVGFIKSRMKYFYVYGEFRYEDVFRRVHRTEFCATLRDPDTPGLMMFCPTYNDMD